MSDFNKNWQTVHRGKPPLYKAEICGVNTSKLPVLSSARMREFFVAKERGDPTAREERSTATCDWS